MAKIQDRERSLLLDLLLSSLHQRKMALASHLSEGLAVESLPPLRQRTNRQPRSDSA